MYLCRKCLSEVQQPNWIVDHITYPHKECNWCGKVTNCLDIHIDHILGLKNETDKLMEKTIKMSLETARKLWKECIANDWIGIADALRENFTKEELEGKKGFTWEESFNGSGYYICDRGTILGIGNSDNSSLSRVVYKTYKQALSALAFAQLTHIVDKYNRDENRGAVTWDGYFHLILLDQNDTLFILRTSIKRSNTVDIAFNFEKDAKTSLEVNRELWEQYYML